MIQTTTLLPCGCKEVESYIGQPGDLYPYVHVIMCEGCAEEDLEQYDEDDWF